VIVPHAWKNAKFWGLVCVVNIKFQVDKSPGKSFAVASAAWWIFRRKRRFANQVYLIFLFYHKKAPLIDKALWVANILFLRVKISIFSSFTHTSSDISFQWITIPIYATYG